jgi:hypothetical protein
MRAYEIRTADGPPDFDFEPCFTVSGRYSSLDDIVDGKEKLIRRATLVFEYDYPLSHTVRFARTRKNGWTRRALAKQIREDYERIYREEDEAVGRTGHIPGMLNRDKSEGPYGIWGHDIDDLVVERVKYNPRTHVVRFDIGS